MKRRIVWAAFGVAALAAWVLVGPAQLGGGATYVTAYGTSMEPAISGGDLVVVRRAQDYQVGDVVAYRSEPLKAVVLHRVVTAERGRYSVQGDKNPWLDPDRPTASQILGSQWLRIPSGGTWLRRVVSPPALGAAAFALVFTGATATSVRQRKKDRRVMAQHSAAARRSFLSLTASRRPVAVSIATLGILAVAVAATVWSRPLEVTPATRSVTSTVDFSYSAKVPPSPVYDGTTVTDPQPVFRALADAVDVAFAYVGPPGTVTVDAELSTPGGWTSTLQLAEPQTFEGRRYADVVTLDLSAIQQRADAAAALTGLPATTVDMAVVPRVSLDDGGHVEPRLELTLDAHALRLGGEPSTAGDVLTVAESVSVAGNGRPAPTISALGWTADAMTARTVSLTAVAVVALMAAACAVVMRRSSSPQESERIRRKYGQLILPVLPVALPHGRPVIDVPGVESLAKLAERYGLLVLHWSRSGVDTYVVQDDATTYRYRSSHPTDLDESVIAEATTAAAAEQHTPVET